VLHLVAEQAAQPLRLRAVPPLRAAKRRAVRTRILSLLPRRLLLLLLLLLPPLLPLPLPLPPTGAAAKRCDVAAT
jgi:hypothetical protein